jgi:hypothetical protein
VTSDPKTAASLSKMSAPMEKQALIDEETLLVVVK